MSGVTNLLQSLIFSLVPQAIDEPRLKEKLLTRCLETLESHSGQDYDRDIGHLADLVRKQFQQSPVAPGTSLRFTNLLSRLLDQPVLSRKHESILFLRTLSPAAQGTSVTGNSFLPSLVPPPSNTAGKPMAMLETSSLSGLAGQKGKSKAEKLKEYRLKIGRSHLPEQLLLRDTLYLLQGISGKYVQMTFSDSVQGSQLDFMDDLKYIISPPVKTLLHRLSEVGYLYSRIERYVKDRDAQVGVGMIEQSLCHHLQTQLTEYYRFMAVLESQLSSVSSTAHQENVRKDGSVTNLIEEAGLNLKRLDVWINEWRLRMRMMSVCVEGARNAHGGALVNLIHTYSDNGDPFVRNFTDQLLGEVSKPFFSTLHKWLFSGELHDPYNEFFVVMDPELVRMNHLHPSSLSGGITQLSADGGLRGLGANNEDAAFDQAGLRLWEAKYQFQKEMLPMFVGEAFGRKIFSTGKSLNFIRYSCHDSDWVVTREKMSNTGGTLKYSDIAGLERSIDSAYLTASQRLFEVFIEKFRLLDHLQALKHYLLLGYGDFAEQLMEALGPSLARPANTLYRHNLTATLESAIRSSNAQNDPPDILRRLDGRMLEYSHGEIGWEVFHLEYKVDPPIDTVINSESMTEYIKLFNHLWKMKRVEVALSQGWMRIAGGSRTFLQLADFEYDWHQIRIVMSEMIHFVRQMRAYCQLEVIECSWIELMDFLAKREGDLDALINAHWSYLDRIVKKILLWSPKSGREQNLLFQVREAFSTILQFREATDTFYNYCLTESARRDQLRDAQRGVFTGHDRSTSPYPTTDALPRIRQLIKEYSASFSERAQSIVHGLQTHPDLDCRFLGIRLSFSDFYKTKKEHQILQQKSS